VALGVLAHHERELELVAALAGDRRADQARGVLQEEGDLVRRDVLGRHDEVALVLAVLVVDDDDDLPRPMAATASSMGLANRGRRSPAPASGRRPGDRRRSRAGEELLCVLGHDVDLQVDGGAGRGRPRVVTAAVWG
jgi:hypothetical protein